jgi:CBS domain-containing protein
MDRAKKVSELIIPLEDYPHIPYWFTLRQAMAIVQEASLKFAGSFEPRAVLVFDEKYQLLGLLTLRDLIKGLAPRFLKETELIKTDPSLTVLFGDLSGPKLEEQSRKPVSEVMSPIRVVAEAQDNFVKALYLMIKADVGLMPVLESDRVIGIIRLSDLFNEVSKLVLGD